MWPANNCLLRRNVVQLCLAANNILLLLLQRSLLRKNGRSLCFRKIFITKQTRWSNDKTIIEFSYRRISWFVSGEQINYSDYLPQPSVSRSYLSSRHWQITIFCSSSSNNCHCFPRDLTLYLPAPSFSSKLVTLSLPYMAAVWSGVCPSKSDTFTWPVHLISLLRVFMSPVLAALFIRWANWNSLMVPPRAFRCSATSWWPFTTASE